MDFPPMTGHDLINVVRVSEPVALVREHEAAERAEDYPKLAGAGRPDFGVAEQHGPTWRIVGLGCMEPQGARADLAAHLRASLKDADEAVRAEGLAVAARLDPEEGEPAGGNEWVVADRRYRIVRTQGYVRLGADGPEPVRSTDTEPPTEHPACGFALEPAAPASPADAALRLDLINLVPAPGTVSPEALDEAAAALGAYPGVVLLPVDYVVVEQCEGSWLPVTRGHGPKEARRSLGLYFETVLPRIGLPGRPPPTPEELAPYLAAAARLSEESRNEFTVHDRRFRVIRVINTIRVGPDGPEPARPTDEHLWDP
ncbi:DUF5954 family protein [Thermomonospora umbrina]|nr:DUF5954 family protein [Thermomonospora umbrina]